MLEDRETIYSREWLPNLADLEPYIAITDEAILLEKQYNLDILAKERIAGQDQIALVVGRFQPPHAGHFYLIESALQLAETAVIGIGSVNVRNDDNPFTALRREYILRNVLRRNGLEDRVKFVYLPDYNDDEKWCVKTLEQAEQWGKVDMVVGNNGWVNNIFRKRGYNALEINELERGSFQGTNVRAKLRKDGKLRPFGTL